MPSCKSRPRHYAAEIIILPTLEQRRAALANVPEIWRSWVKEYVIYHFHKLHCLRRHHEQKRIKC